MPTLQTCDVQATGGDETTIQAAIDNIATYTSGVDLVANDEVYRIRVEAATYAEFVSVNAGVTADATRRIEIVPQAGDHHLGVWAAGVQVQPSSGTGTVFEILDPYTYVYGIEMRLPSTAATGDAVVMLGDASNDVQGVIIDECMIHADAPSIFVSDGVATGNWNVGTSGNRVLIRNTVIAYTWRGGVSFRQTGFSGTFDQYVDVVNCSFHDNNRDIGYQISSTSGTVTTRVYNCIASGTFAGELTTTSTPLNGTLVTTGSDKNFGTLGSTGPAFPGTDGVDWTVVTTATGTANEIGITSTTAPADMLLLTGVDNDILDLGVGPATQSLVSDTSINGNARAGTTCDPGAYQVTEVASGGTPPSLLSASATTRRNVRL